MSSDDDIFADMVAGLDELATLDIEAAAAPLAPALDAMLEWKIVNDAIVIYKAHPLPIMVRDVFRTQPPSADSPLTRFVIPEGDLRATMMSAHEDGLITEANGYIDAALEFLEGYLPLVGLFDAARGFQMMRLRLLGSEETPSHTVEMMAMVCGGFSEDLLALSL